MPHRKTLRRLMLIASLIPTAATAQDRAAIREACRGDIRQVCGLVMTREAIGACIRENFTRFSAPCQDALRAAMQDRARTAMRSDPPTTPSGVTRRTVRYANTPGVDARRQSMDIYQPAGGGARRPVVLFLHGGGWAFGDKLQGAKAKPAFITGEGYVFAAANYRFRPDATIDDMVADIGAALRHLRSEADRYGIDPDRIAIMGHSAGAHLAALAALDKAALQRAGVPQSAIKAAVLIDGAGYDVARQMQAGGRIYQNAFGDNPADWRRWSPLTHAAGSPTSFMILHVANRADARAQSEALARAIGPRAGAVSVAGKTHFSINDDLGKPEDALTGQVAAFLKRAL